jgi:flagellar protein FlbB
MKKALKIFFITILIILLLAGAGFSLLYFKIFKTPSFVSYIPVVSNLLIEEEVTVKVPPEVIALDKAKKENASLKNAITAKQEEMQEMQKQINDLKKELKNSENEAFKLKDEVARLNEEILNLKTSKGNKKAAYKDMAEYFAEMKSKDAADILSRLKDEDIIGIFNEMPKDMVAEMLQKMDRDKATTLTRKMLVTEP